MIAEVGAALRALYSPLVPDGSAVRFGPPGQVPDGPGPVLSVFLAAIREDPDAGTGDWADVRDADGRVLGRRPPIRRFDLAYLVTAWGGDDRQEAELLDRVLVATGQRLDQALFDDDTRASGVPVTVRLDPDAARVYADLGLPPRTVLGVTVTAPLVLPLVTDLAPPAEEIAVGVRRGVPGRTAGPNGNGRGRWRSARIDERPAESTGGDDAGRGQAG